MTWRTSASFAPNGGQSPVGDAAGRHMGRFCDASGEESSPPTAKSTAINWGRLFSPIRKNAKRLRKLSTLASSRVSKTLSGVATKGWWRSISRCCLNRISLDLSTKQSWFTVRAPSKLLASAAAPAFCAPKLSNASGPRCRSARSAGKPIWSS